MCRRQGLGKALEETEPFNTQACFLQGKKPKFRSPGRLGAFTNNLVSFCYSIWSHPSQILPNPGHYLGPYLEFCLSVPRTHPYERGHKYFSISINRTRPYTFILNPSSVGPYPECYQPIKFFVIVKVMGALLLCKRVSM